MSEISTRKFLTKLKQAVPECKLFQTQGEPVIGVVIPYAELTNFMEGRTQFTRGTYKPLVTFGDCDWTVILDAWVDEKVGMALIPTPRGMELRIYPERKEKK